MSRPTRTGSAARAHGAGSVNTSFSGDFLLSSRRVWRSIGQASAPVSPSKKKKKKRKKKKKKKKKKNLQLTPTNNITRDNQ